MINNNNISRMLTADVWMVLFPNYICLCTEYNL